MGSFSVETVVRGFHVGMLLLERNYPAEEMLEFSRSLRSSYGEGFYYSRPCAKKDFIHFFLSFFDSGPRGSGSLLDSPFSTLVKKLYRDIA